MPGAGPRGPPASIALVYSDARDNRTNRGSLLLHVFPARTTCIRLILSSPAGRFCSAPVVQFANALDSLRGSRQYSLIIHRCGHIPLFPCQSEGLAGPRRGNCRHWRSLFPPCDAANWWDVQEVASYRSITMWGRGAAVKCGSSTGHPHGSNVAGVVVSGSVRLLDEPSARRSIGDFSRWRSFSFAVSAARSISIVRPVLADDFVVYQQSKQTGAET